MTEIGKKQIRKQSRFDGIFDPEKYKDGMFADRILLTSFIRSNDSKRYLDQAFEAGFDGSLRTALERKLADYIGKKYALAVTSGDAALSLALKIAAEKLGNSISHIGGSLQGYRIFCSDLTSADMVSPIVFEGAEPIFIDSYDETPVMDPEVLEMAFEKYPDVRIVVLSHIYGFPGQVQRIKDICSEHGALLIECVGDSLGSQYTPGDDNLLMAGAAGYLTALYFSPDSPLGPVGGALLSDDHDQIKKAAFLASGAAAAAPWRQHEELGFGYLMGDADAAVLLGQLMHIDEAIEKKRLIYERYCDNLDSDLMGIIYAEEGALPNCWITAMTCESGTAFMETRDDREYTYRDIHGTASPMEIYDVLSAFNADCRPVYKPMSMQPVYRNCERFTLDGSRHSYDHPTGDTLIMGCDFAREFYERGICLPSDIGMTDEEQDIIIELIHASFNSPDF